MTDTELANRLREAIVLDGPDIWRTNGFMADAQAAGLSTAQAEALAAEVGAEVSRNSLLFNGISDRIARLAQPARSAYREQDTSRIILAAQSLNLSPDFVRDRWIPAELAKIAPPPTPPAPKPIVVEPVVVEPPVTAPESTDAYKELLEPEPLPPVEPEPAAPAGETVESMRRKVYDSLNDYGDRIPAPAIRSLFRTISYDETELAVAIWNYLQIEGYQPIALSSSDDLREKVTSTDWQIPVRQAAPPPPEPVYVPPVLPEPLTPVVHSFTATPARVVRGKPVTLEWDVENLLAVTIDDLGEGLSPKNRGWIKPKKTADYTLFDVNNNPLSTVRVEVIPPDRSGLYGVLFALFLLLVIYYFVRGSASGNNAGTEETTRREEPRTRAEPTGKNTDLHYNGPESAPPAEPAPQPTPDETTATDTKIAESTAEKPEEAKSSVPEPEPATVPAPRTPQDARRGKYEEAFGDKPYDKVELGDDDRGWRRARKNGKWGYIDANDQWTIEPEFDAVTPFKGNTAAAFMNGQLITIDRDGRQVRN